MYEVQLAAESTRVFLVEGGKKLRLPEGFLCFQYCSWELLAITLVLLEPFSL